MKNKETSKAILCILLGVLLLAIIALAFHFFVFKPAPIMNITTTATTVPQKMVTNDIQIPKVGDDPKSTTATSVPSKR